MLSRLISGLSAFVCIFGVGVVIGYQASSTQCELEKTEFQNEVLEKQAQADRKTQDVENAYKDAIINTQTSTSLGINLINAKFASVDRGLFNSVDYGVHHNEASASNLKPLPNLTEPTTGVQVSPCKCDRQDRAKLQRLYEQQLEVAKDCEITTTYYNKILELWNAVQYAPK